jgi:ribosomal protein S27AE
MMVHTGIRTADRVRPVRLPACPQCGDMLLAPLLAEHVSPQHVRNHWACEACGHTFRKSFQVDAVDETVMA